jgi:hypothetical protein
MRKCPFCAEQIQDQATVCRFCNRNLSARAGRNVKALIGIIILLIVFVAFKRLSDLTGDTARPASDQMAPAGAPTGSQVRPNDDGGSNGVPKRGAARDLLVQNASWGTDQFGNRTIAGTVINNGTETYRYVQVSINLYDSSGVQIGSTSDNVANLEPGRSWKFEVNVLEGEATDFKIMDVTGLRR